MKYNRSIQRCLLLLQQFRVNPLPTLSDLSKGTELPRATTLRILMTLEEEGYVVREEGRWRLTSKMLEIGFAVLESMGVNDLVQSILQALATKFDGTANIGEKSSNSVLVIARALASAERRRLHIANLHIGSVLGSESALYKALSLDVGTGFAERVYEPVNQLSIAVPIPTSAGRKLALGVSLDMSTCNSQLEKQEVANFLTIEADKIGRIVDSGQI